MGKEGDSCQDYAQVKKNKIKKKVRPYQSPDFGDKFCFVLFCFVFVFYFFFTILIITKKNKNKQTK